MSKIIFNSMLFCLLTYLQFKAATAADTTSLPCSHTNPCPLKGGAPLPKCPELRSKDGFLDVVITVDVGYFQFDWLELPRRSYNGTLCPTTLRVKPGDMLNVKLVNELRNGSHVPEGNIEVNVTNLHTHGLHISSEEPQDNIFVEIHPGESYQYSFKIFDYHAPGTNWYHPHHHKSMAIQTAGGMAGMLIVEDDPDTMPSELRAVSCPENCQHDIPLIVSPVLSMDHYVYYQKIYGDALRVSGDLEKWLGKNVDNFTVNGEYLPVISLERNQLTRFRILNVGQSTPLELYVVDEQDNVAPCAFREIARDGIYFDEPVLPKAGQSVLHPGNRVDWLIKCTEIGTFKLYSHAKPEYALSFSGGGRRSNVIATITVTPESQHIEELNFPAILPTRPLSYLPDLRDSIPDNYITVEIGGNNELNRDVWTEKNYYRFKVEVDSVVEIQMISADYNYPHPMHFHMNHVQVIEYQPYTGPVAYYQYANPTWEFRDFDGNLCYYQHPNYVEGAVSQQFNTTDPLEYQGHYDRWVNDGNDSLAYDRSGQWLDTVYSPGLSNITLRMKTDRYTGPLVIHCHHPSDSDLGMKMVIEVVEKGADLSNANILSGGAAPGSCKKCEWNRFMEPPPECSNGIMTTFTPSQLIFLLLATLLAVPYISR